jgi:hypothetical protein
LRGDGARLHARCDLVDDLESGLFLVEVLALVEAEHADDAPHVVRVTVARRGLIDEARFFDARFGRDAEHHGGHLIDGRDVQHQLLVDGNLRLPFERDEDERGGRRESLVPAGEGVIFRRFDD